MAKETISKVKGKLTEQEPTLANHTVDKGQYLKYIKN